MSFLREQYDALAKERASVIQLLEQSGWNLEVVTRGKLRVEVHLYFGQMGIVCETLDELRVFLFAYANGQDDGQRAVRKQALFAGT
jgi:hypothetical protein